MIYIQITYCLQTGHQFVPCATYATYATYGLHVIYIQVTSENIILHILRLLHVIYIQFTGKIWVPHILHTIDKAICETIFPVQIFHCHLHDATSRKRQVVTLPALLQALATHWPGRGHPCRAGATVQGRSKQPRKTGDASNLAINQEATGSNRRYRPPWHWQE